MEMLQTVADDIWGRPCLAYHVQPDLAPGTQAALARLQQEVAGLWPVPLLLGPVSSLHVTIYALAGVKDRFDKRAYWQSVAEPCRELLAGLCAGHPALTLSFFGLKVTDTAIIAVAREESGLVAEIRRRIAETLPPPPGQEPLRYSLVHSTLARYPACVPVPAEHVARVERLPVAIEASVRRIKVIGEALFPCQDTWELASFPLGPAPSPLSGPPPLE